LYSGRLAYGKITYVKIRRRHTRNIYWNSLHIEKQVLTVAHIAAIVTLNELLIKSSIIVRARDQTLLRCEFVANPFGGSRDISYTNKKVTDSAKKTEPYAVHCVR